MRNGSGEGVERRDARDVRQLGLDPTERLFRPSPFGDVFYDATVLRPPVTVPFEPRDEEEVLDAAVGHEQPLLVFGIERGLSPFDHLRHLSPIVGMDAGCDALQRHRRAVLELEDGGDDARQQRGGRYVMDDPGQGCRTAPGHATRPTPNDARTVDDQQARLDEALMETFPASDPVAIGSSD